MIKRNVALITHVDMLRHDTGPGHPERPEWVKRICQNNHTTIDSPDTPISGDSFRAALLAVGTGLLAADLIAEGTLTRAFCPVRPSGHHAEKSRAMGFCLFNNIAILVRYLQEKHGYRKIPIVDWDVPHGNGTQHAFYNDNTVFYLSTHQFPHYPGTGAESERGSGPGEGLMRNVPLGAKTLFQHT